MKKSTLSLLATAAVLACGGAYAQQQATQSRLYGELGYSHLDVTSRAGGVGVSAHPGILRGIVGYNAHPNIAVEGMLGFGVRDGEFSGTALGVPFNGDMSVRRMAGLFVKPKWQSANIELFGRFGWVHSRVRTTATALGVGATQTESEGDAAYGLGVNYQFSPRAYAGLDLMRYHDKDNTKVDGVTLSVATRW